jgi:hypothetical protein
MPMYNVALWVKDSSNNEFRYDATVHGDDRSDAIEEASNKVKGKVVKVISVEQIDG